MSETQEIVAMESAGTRIFLVRGQRVMLDDDLTALYEIETAALNYVVTRNIERFPDGFMFRLNPDEFADMKSRYAISCREAPYVFTGQGLALLSSILIDERENRKYREFCAPTCSCQR